jgi:hypothetical protein
MLVMLQVDLPPCSYYSCKVVFLDTDQLPAHHSRVGDLVQNDVEGKLVYQITEAFLRSGVTEDQIGIMSLYRQQIKLLSHLLQDRKGIEILTADRSQGRDKDCIIISMVRSNDQGQVCATGCNYTICVAISPPCADWRLDEGLAAGQRVVHTCTVEVDHHWLPKDLGLDKTFVGVLSAHGRA